MCKAYFNFGDQNLTWYKSWYSFTYPTKV